MFIFCSAGEFLRVEKLDLQDRWKAGIALRAAQNKRVEESASHHFLENRAAKTPENSYSNEISIFDFLQNVGICKSAKFKND